MDLRCSALDFRNLANYIARSLLETGGFRPRLHRIVESRLAAGRNNSGTCREAA